MLNYDKYFTFPVSYYRIPSNIKLTLRTFTVGSPIIPRKRPVVHSFIMPRTLSSLIPFSRARRLTWYSAAAGEIAGSRPLPEHVTRSTGIGVFPFSGWAFLIFSTRSATSASNSGLAGLKFDGDEYINGFPSLSVYVLRSTFIIRPHMWLSAVKFWPKSSVPYVWPSISIMLPFALSLKKSWATPVTANVYIIPHSTVNIKKTNADFAMIFFIIKLLKLSIYKLFLCSGRKLFILELLMNFLPFLPEPG